MSLNVTFPSQVPHAESQHEIIELFNRLIKKRPIATGPLGFKHLFSNTTNNIDSEHEVDENVRIQLERKFKSFRKNALDARALLTDGPFKGKSLLWVACYIAASTYTFYDEDDNLLEGYSYILGRLIDKAIPSTIDYSAEYTSNNKTVSALWLAMYSHLKSLSKDGMWILTDILKLHSKEELLQLDFNGLSTKDDRVAVSPLALVIQADIAVTRENYGARNFVHQLLKKIPPKEHPEFFNFNAPVLDLGSLGMTTLCLAAKGDADFISAKEISSESPFISIIRAADLKLLDFKAKIRKGPDRGKTPLWYACFMLKEDDDEGMDCILENARFDQLDFNDHPEDPNDKNANKTALWFVSHYYAKNNRSKHFETILAKSQDLSKYDFNNRPTSPKDKHSGKTVLWNLGEAALNGKQKPFIRVLKAGSSIPLDYSARAQTGPNSDKSVLGFALALAKGGSFKALDLILNNIQTYGLNPDAIQGFELEMLCYLAKRNQLYPLEILLPYIKMKPDYLNREISSEPRTNVTFMLMELAWFGYPHFMKVALQGIETDALTMDRKHLNERNLPVVKELNNIVQDISKYGEKENQPKRPILKGFLESGYEELTEQLDKLKIVCASQADIMDYKEIAEPIVTLTTKYKLLPDASKRDAPPKMKDSLKGRMDLKKQ